MQPLAYEVEFYIQGQDCHEPLLLRKILFFTARVLQINLLASSLAMNRQLVFYRQELKKRFCQNGQVEQSLL